MPRSTVKLKADGIEICFQPYCGIITSMVVQDQGRALDMFHRAPWVGSDAVMPNGAPPHQADLAGDFFCAPFGDAGVDSNAPLHGWPANSQWHQKDTAGDAKLVSVLGRKVMGADLVKELSLCDGHPFLYQRHIFSGGTGMIPVANHAMISMPNGGLLRFSPKRWFETPAMPPEPDPSRGRSCLKYPARSASAKEFPAASGGMIDLTHYPFGSAHEDFVSAIESPDSPLGWTAIARPTEGDLYVSLRHPRRSPMTMLWHSNGGRDYAPWLGWHKACLGVEEGIALSMLGITSKDDPDLLAQAGQAAALALFPRGSAEVRHITGFISWPEGEGVQDIQMSDNELLVVGEHGASRRLPIQGDFLQL